MSFIESSDSFEAYDGLRLFSRSWLAPEYDPNRVLVVQHGVGEHGGRYGHLIDALRDTGISIFAIDSRGHGRSDGTRGDARSLDQLVDDLEAFILVLRERHGIDRPLLLGHSLGGLIVTRFALRYSNQWELKALLISGPAFKVPVNMVQNVKKVSAQVLRHVSPGLVLATGLPLQYISHDQDTLESYKTDPLIHDKLSIRLALSVLEAGEEVLRDASLLQIPLWIGHGQEDKITDPSGSVEFFRQARSEDKTLRLYPGLLHEIFNETLSERDQVLRDVRDWIQERFGPAPAPIAPDPVATSAPAADSV